MNQSQHLRRNILLCILVTLVLIFATRIITMGHNAELHPDEYVYFYSAKSMINYLQGDAPSYQTAKVYPEGAFLFQMPFQLLYRHFGLKDALHLQLSGRMASIFYFAVGVVLGFLLINRLFGKSLRLSVIYGLTMVFSLFHMEQSRYGTSESLIFLFLMLDLLMCSRVNARKGNRTLALIAASIACGVLTSMKYPLLYFILFPLLAGLRTSRTRLDKLISVELVVLFMLVGFFLVSPTSLRDINYVITVINNEWGSYVGGGNLSEMGGVYNHILSVGLYLILYAGLLGGPLLAIPLLRRRGKQAEPEGEPEQAETKDNLSTMRKFDIPLVLLGFLLYNLFTTTLFMRTLYPLICVIDLYACAGLNTLMGSDSRRVRCLAAALLAVTVLRGGTFFAVLAGDTNEAKLQQAIDTTVDDTWQNTTLMGPGRNYLLPVDKDGLKKPEEVDIDNAVFSNPESLVLLPGEMVITASLEHSKCSPYILPIDNKTINKRLDRWEKFQVINRDYLRYQPYPEWYFPVFGGWLKGTTITDYEFPLNRIYYRPVGN